MFGPANMSRTWDLELGTSCKPALKFINFDEVFVNIFKHLGG